MTNDKGEATLLRVIQLLLQGISLHAVEGNPEDRERFREALNAVSRAIEEEPDAEGILIHACTAIRTLQDYNQRTDQNLGAQHQELQDIVKMLTSTIGSICQNRKRERQAARRNRTAGVFRYPAT
jgi:hypothetical protein